ncbi:hypothetical protein DSQ19_08155 [Candidatus Nitrosotenuis sp. DW1]|nr:hypothetical protein DSQ19_08155 [Candidatus Nitrosotenuis sp. DW1]
MKAKSKNDLCLRSYILTLPLYLFRTVLTVVGKAELVVLSSDRKSCKLQRGATKYASEDSKILKAL